jgi:hypothetical protein
MCTNKKNRVCVLWSGGKNENICGENMDDIIAATAAVCTMSVRSPLLTLKWNFSV